jgi:hypothetical protein
MSDGICSVNILVGGLRPLGVYVLQDILAIGSLKILF